MRILVLVVLCLLASVAHSADGVAVASKGAIERENLAKIVGEIDYLRQRLDVYARHADGRAGRYSFDYPGLAADLRAMRKGIVEYIKRDLSLARQIPPLRTEYVIDLGDTNGR